MGKQPAKDNDYANDHIKHVKDYYDRTTPAYLEYLGTSFQAALLRTGTKTSSQISNFYFLAKQAGIKPGDKVLDSGCGVCGPSIDIAHLIDDLHIEAITISLSQACIASQRIQEHGLNERIHVNYGDFHYLPFPDNFFDVVFFLESASHSNDLDQLFSQVYRVLRPGGLLYVKDLYIKEQHLSPRGTQALKRFNECFSTEFRTLNQTVDAIINSKLLVTKRHDISHLVSQDKWGNAFIEEKNGQKTQTDFARLHDHYNHIDEVPIIWGEIIARKLT